MKKLFKISILPIAIIVMLMGFANVAFAVDPLNVVFENNPLFGEVNFLPGDIKEGDVGVTNNTDTIQNVYAESVNGSDPDGLGSQMRLRVLEGLNVRYDDVFSDFLSAGPVSLSALDSGSTTYTFEVSFLDSTDNNYQGKSLGFDLCIGFSGGNLQCGDTIVSGEDGDGDGGSISSSGSGSIVLTIFNEQALNISSVDESGIATITWNTNKLATSQVIYGPTPPAYILDIVEPYLGYFGYPLGTVEDTTKVINHSVSLTGLIPGQTYVYRVVSRASPPTISPEHQFTVPSITSPLAQAGAGAVLGASAVGGGNGEPEPAGSALGETYPDTEETPGLSENLAAVFASGFGEILSICTLIALFILLAIYLIWRLWLRKEYEKNLVAEEEILNRFYLFFGGSALLAILICVVLSEYCPLPVFVIAFIISLCLYAYRKFKIE